jgi:hypothetical protein
MSVSREKVMKYGIAGVFCSFFVWFALSATLVDGTVGDCHPGMVCALPIRTLETAVGSFDGRSISYEQFAYAQIGAFIPLLVVLVLFMRMVAASPMNHRASRAK